MTTRALIVVTALLAGGGVLAQSGSSTAGKPTPRPAAPQAAKPIAKPASATATAPAAAAGPIIVVETERGTFEFETYPQDAPKTVAQITALVRRNFYNGQRIHRVEPGFVIQWGDQNTRDMRNRGKAGWGSYGSGKPIGTAEIKRPHKAGAVGMAHSGNPAAADSQIYVAVTAERTRTLDGKYTVFGQVISGMDVVRAIRKDDLIKRVTIKGGTPPAK
jgi:cyclophilin family peptidyl-prolyl cis-trans isomerase